MRKVPKSPFNRVAQHKTAHINVLNILFFSSSLSNKQADRENLLKFIYSEKATNFYEISTVDLSYVVMVKSTVEISEICGLLRIC